MEKNMTVNVGACPVDICHDTKACVPVTINTFAEAGEPLIECCDCPEIKRGSKCEGCTDNCRCEFTVSQAMRIQIPLFFGADIGIGEACVDPGGTSALSDGKCCSSTRHECDCIDDDCDDEPASYAAPETRHDDFDNHDESSSHDDYGFTHTTEHEGGYTLIP